MSKKIDEAIKKIKEEAKKHQKEGQSFEEFAAKMEASPVAHLATNEVFEEMAARMIEGQYLETHAFSETFEEMLKKEVDSGSLQTMQAAKLQSRFLQMQYHCYLQNLLRLTLDHIKILGTPEGYEMAKENLRKKTLESYDEVVDIVESKKDGVTKDVKKTKEEPTTH